MIKNKYIKKIIAIAEQVAIAIFLSFIIILIVNLTCGNLLKNVISLANVTVKEENSEALKTNITFDHKAKKLKTYPKWGEKFGTITISSIDKKDIPVYHGDTLDIIKNGAGHNAGTYFPGEGGSIVIGAHNSMRDFYKLPQVNVGDNINISTDYGLFDYKVYKTDIINAKDDKKLPIQEDEEILMLYTCYPVSGIGYRTERFVVYAKLALVEGEK